MNNKKNHIKNYTPKFNPTIVSEENSFRMKELVSEYDFPRIKFPSEWEIEIIPPYFGPVYRFIVHYNDKSVSVYFDIDSCLGAMDAPYFEIFLLTQGEEQIQPERFHSDQTEEMIERIKRLLQ